MVSQMALLRTGNRAERLLIPAFVYFFAQLYPFRAGQPAAGAGRPPRRAAACWCAPTPWPRPAAWTGSAARGSTTSRSAGCSSGRAGRCWLGLTTDVTSPRPYDRLADIWDMVARSAYTQLRYSLAATAGPCSGWPGCTCCRRSPAIAGLACSAAERRGHRPAAWLAAAGLAGWLLMAVSLRADAPPLPAVRRCARPACR